MDKPDAETTAALNRLLEIASHDTGQSRRCADFLLSWWNAENCGGFDPTNLWGVDLQIKRDIVRMPAFIALNPYYPCHGGGGRVRNIPSARHTLSSPIPTVMASR